MTAPKVKFKRSSVANKRPELGNLELGELALNTFDGYLFTRQDTGGIGIGTTVTLLNPWQENYGATGISYDGQINITGITTFTNNVSVTAGLDVTGTTTLGVVTSVTSIEATTYYGDGSNLTGISAGAASTSNVSSDTTISGIVTVSSQFYPPSLTTAERDALVVTQGALIFNNTENKLQMYLGSEWKSLAFELNTYTSIGI